VSAGLRGLLPETRFAPSLEERLTKPLPPAPSEPFDYAAKVAGGFPMAGNDKLGDCTIAGWVHLCQLAYAAVGETYTYPGDEAVAAAYWKLVGHGPQYADDPGPGLQMTQVLSAASQGAGLLGVKAVAWGSVNIHSKAALRNALYNFGALYLAGDIPADAETQFPGWWHLVTGSHPAVGGHCFTASGNELKDLLTGLDSETWGAENGFTWNWWARYGVSAFVVVPECFVTAGHGPLDSIDVAALEDDVRGFAAAA
jgi:hypothetical protein